MSHSRPFMFLVVAVPLLLIAGWPHPWWLTFVIGLLASGVAGGVEALLNSGAEPAEYHAAEKTPVDQQWEWKMVLKKSVASEGRREWDEAATLFQQVLRKAHRHEDVEPACQHL